METGLNKRIFSWAALALASTTFLSACGGGGGGGGGGVSSDGSAAAAAAAAQQAPSAVAGYTAVSSTVSGGLGYPFGS
ncbi:MAG: hypothetical protein B7X59_13065, partial [Polaromonas sp. 39-63-203]